MCVSRLAACLRQPVASNPVSLYLTPIRGPHSGTRSLKGFAKSRTSQRSLDDLTVFRFGTCR